MLLYKIKISIIIITSSIFIKAHQYRELSVDDDFISEGKFKSKTMLLLVLNFYLKSSEGKALRSFFMKKK